MSSISTIYDAIVDVIESQLPTHRRLPNPYLITENTYLNLDKGFAIAVGEGRDTERYINGCFVTWERRFAIVLVRRVTTTDNNIGLRETIEKEILEDHAKLKKAFFLNNELNGTAIKSIVSDDGGLNFIDAATLKFLAMEVSLFVEYQESPS